MQGVRANNSQAGDCSAPTNRTIIVATVLDFDHCKPCSSIALNSITCLGQGLANKLQTLTLLMNTVYSQMQILHQHCQCWADSMSN